MYFKNPITVVVSYSVRVSVSRKRAECSLSRGDEPRGPGGWHTALTWVSPDLADPGPGPGPGSIFTGWKPSSFPVLSGAQFLEPHCHFESGMSAQVPRPASFLCLPSPHYLFPFPSRSGCPSGSDNRDVVTGVSSLWSHLLWQEVWSDQMPLWKLSWIFFIFYHFILTSQQSPPVRVSAGNSAIHQFKVWPYGSGRHPTPEKKSLLSFSFFFRSKKESAHLDTGILTFEPI